MDSANPEERSVEFAAEPPGGATRNGSEDGAALHPLLQILDDIFHVPHNVLATLNDGLPGGAEDFALLRQNLIGQKVVTQDVFQQALALLFEMDFMPGLDNAELSHEFTQQIPIRYAKKFGFFPFRMSEDTLWVALEDPRALP